MLDQHQVRSGEKSLPSASSSLSSSLLQVMYAQESKEYYRTNDYLSDYHYTTDDKNLLDDLTGFPVDMECRTKMVEWCYQVASFCNYNGETVAISINYLDRLTLTSNQLLKDRTLFQLAAMTCFYTAVKIHEDEVMDLKMVEFLSQGLFTQDQVVEMERLLLQSLQWRMNPPTALAFVRQFMELFPDDVLSESEREELYDVSTLQTELALQSSVFVGGKASDIGLAALKNSLLLSSTMHPKRRRVLSRILDDHLCTAESEDILDMQEKLCSAMATRNSSSDDHHASCSSSVDKNSTKPLPKLTGERSSVLNLLKSIYIYLIE